jgi:hypothetical protein
MYRMTTITVLTLSIDHSTYSTRVKMLSMENKNAVLLPFDVIISDSNNCDNIKRRSLYLLHTDEDVIVAAAAAKNLGTNYI